MVDSKLVNTGDFRAIEALTKQAVSIMHGFRLAHIGINAEDDERAEAISSLICALFGMPMTKKPESFFAADTIEVMRSPGFGKYGHVAIKCNSIKRAMFYLESRESSSIRRVSGRMPTEILRPLTLKRIGGFAFHLI